MSSIRLPSNVIKLPTTFAGNRGVRANTSARPRIDFSTEFGRMYAGKMMSEKRPVSIDSTGGALHTSNIVYQTKSPEETNSVIGKLMEKHPDAYNVSFFSSYNCDIDLSPLAGRLPAHAMERRGRHTPHLIYVENGANVTLEEIAKIVANNWGKELTVFAMGNFFHKGNFFGHMELSLYNKTIQLSNPINEGQVLEPVDWP